jgi:site-specific recombinase XerC
MSLEIAESLLQGEGLNHSSYIRALGLENNIKSKKDTKGEYEKILKSYEDVIEKQGHDWFYKKKEEVQKVVTEDPKEDLEKAELKRENSRLKQELSELKSQLDIKNKPTNEPRAWRYHKTKPEGKIFYLSEIEELDSSWKDHPDKV